MNITGLILGGVALAGASGFVGAQFQKGLSAAECEQRVGKVRQGAIDALNAQGQALLTVTAERDQARSEVDKVNATTAAQFTELQAMLASDQVKREEASQRVEAAAKEAARNARTAGERATAARDSMARITDQCAGAGIPPDIERMLDGILRPGATSASMVGGQLPGAGGPDRP